MKRLYLVCLRKVVSSGLKFAATRGRKTFTFCTRSVSFHLFASIYFSQSPTPILSLFVVSLCFALIFFDPSSVSMGAGGRQILGGCKRSVNFLPEFPIVLSDNSKGFLPSLGGCSPPAPASYAHACFPFYVTIPEYYFLSNAYQHCTTKIFRNYIFQKSKLTLQYGLKSFTYAGAKSWNSIPLQIKKAVSTNASVFKLSSIYFPSTISHKS